MSRLIGCLLLGCIFASLLGCEDPPEIRQYKVAKSRSDLGDIGKKSLQQPPSQPSASEPIPTRMVVAIAERTDATWFFKLTGPIEAVEEHKTEWTELLSNLKFDEQSQPQWDTPDGWNLGPAKPFRHATLLRESEDSKLELSISSLGPNQNMVDNVNRWRGQLGVPPINKDQLDLKPFESKAGELKLFDATGKMGSSSMMPPNMMSSNATAALQQPKLSFDAMDGWEEGTTSEIVKVRLTNGSERTSPQITVTFLAAAANKWIPNAQRWARQVDMDDSADIVREKSSKVTVDGIEGDLIRLIPGDESGKFALIGAMIVRDELAWFFKMIGDKEKIVALEGDFDTFIKSFRFK